MWNLGSAEVVWGLGYKLEKSNKEVTAVFTGFKFEVMDDDVRVVKEKLHTSCGPAYIGTCNRIITLWTGWPVGENEETYIDGFDANDIQTDTATQHVGNRSLQRHFNLDVEIMLCASSAKFK